MCTITCDHHIRNLISPDLEACKPGQKVATGAEMPGDKMPFPWIHPALWWSVLARHEMVDDVSVLQVSLYMKQILPH